MKDGNSAYFISARATHVYTVFAESNLEAAGMMGDPTTFEDNKRYKWLSVPLNDSNQSESAIYLKAGTTAIILQMIENGVMGQDLRIADPVMACETIAADPACTQTLPLQNGESRTAIEIQREHLSLAQKYFGTIGTNAAVEDLLQ